MASNSPWSVKGVDPEAREAAKIAARRAGLTVGQWLSQTILATASQQLRGGNRTAPPRPPEPDYAAGPAGAPPPGYEQPAQEYQAYSAQPPAPTMQAIFESIQKLSARVEDAEVKTTAAIAPLAEQVDHLSQQIDEVRAHSGVSTAPVERAMTRLSERLQKLEERRRPSGKGGLFGLFGSGR